MFLIGCSHALTGVTYSVINSKSLTTVAKFDRLSDALRMTKALNRLNK